MSKKKLVSEMKTKGWDRAAEVYARDRRSGSIHHRYISDPAFLDLLGAVTGKKILDAGCGEGFISRELARRGVKVVGVDLSEKLLNFAEGEEKRNPLGIKYYRSSLENLSDLKDGEFDVVVSNLVLHDLEPIREVLKEFYRVLGEDGMVVISLAHPMRHKNYFKRGWYEIDWGEGYKGLASYHRTISDYLNAFVEVGFVLSEFVEPQVSDEGIKKYPQLEEFNEYPLFLLIKVIKK